MLEVHELAEDAVAGFEATPSPTSRPCRRRRRRARAGRSGSRSRAWRPRSPSSRTGSPRGGDVDEDFAGAGLGDGSSARRGSVSKSSTTTARMGACSSAGPAGWNGVPLPEIYTGWGIVSGAGARVRSGGGGSRAEGARRGGPRRSACESAQCGAAVIRRSRPDVISRARSVEGGIRAGRTRVRTFPCSGRHMRIARDVSPGHRGLVRFIVDTGPRFARPARVRPPLKRPFPLEEFTMRPWMDRAMLRGRIHGRLMLVLVAVVVLVSAAAVWQFSALRDDRGPDFADNDRRETATAPGPTERTRQSRGEQLGLALAHPRQSRPPKRRPPAPSGHSGRRDLRGRRHRAAVHRLPHARQRWRDRSRSRSPSRTAGRSRISGWEITLGLGMRW